MFETLINHIDRLSRIKSENEWTSFGSQNQA